MQPDTSKQVADGLNGTVFLDPSVAQAVEASPDEPVVVRAVANGNKVEIVRRLHKSGEALTIHLQARRELQLNSTDEVQVWVRSVSEGEEPTIQDDRKPPTRTQETQCYVSVRGSPTYHVLRDESDEAALCGFQLPKDGSEYRRGENPGDMLEPCGDCESDLM